MKRQSYQITPFLWLSIAMVLTLCMVASVSAGGGMDMQGKVEVREISGIKVHTYISPEDSNLNATHVIETAQKLVIIDAQFLVPYAMEFRKYVDSLNKEIDRVIISHGHPDHIWGLDAAFADTQVYALAYTINDIKKKAPGLLAARKPKMGDLAPEKIMVPQHTIEPGTQDISGVTYIFESFTGGDDKVQLVVKLPQLKVAFMQDVVYNKTHFFTAADLDDWIATLQKEKSAGGYDIIMAGHGVPTDPSVFDESIAYLSDAKAILANAKDGEDFAARLQEKYPAYKGGLHKLSGSILFKKK